MSTLLLEMLSPFKAQYSNRPLSGFRTKATQALLIYLAVEPERGHGREKLMTLLWPGMPQKSARANLRQTLYQLRQDIPEVQSKSGEKPVALVIANRKEIQLNPAAEVNVDVLRFEGLLAGTANHQHSDLMVCGECRQDLEQAVAIYQDHFLTDFYLEDSNAFEDWAQGHRELYRRKALDALENLTTICTRQQAFAKGQAFAERQLEIDNLRESAYRQLMELLAHAGRREEALAVYERCRRTLVEELGMEPSARTSELYAKILAGDLTPQSPVAQGVRGLELREEIGEGAFGVIHRAFQPSVGRDVAVKVIRRKYANDPEFIRRFEAEAQTVARLEHPYIVPLYDYWRDPEGAYLVMRYVKEGSLESALQAGPWQPERATRLADQIAGALATAHMQGVIHRDLKPANILLDGAGNAYLTDFGIAKELAGAAAGEARITSEGSIVGTLDYISPEQIQNEPVSSQTDIYSFGAVLYETLTGEKPFADASVANLLYSHLNEPIPQVSASRPDIPATVDDVLQKATAKRPADRYDNVLEMATAFSQALTPATAADQQGTVTMTPEVDAMPTVTELYNPYKGLRAFQEADADDFFGRDDLVERLVARLTPDPTGDGRFLALVGPSGSGKSSAVKAGLIPALRAGAVPGSEKWFVAEMVPGNRPLEELATALLPLAVDPPPDLIQPMERDLRGLLRTIRRVLPDEDGSGAQLLLVIDQFEELFTLVEDRERRTFFLDSLLAALNAPRSPLRLAITLRADFYDRPLQQPHWGQLLKENTEVILPLSQAELTWSVREPARRMGVGLEEGLAGAIVADVADQPGGLPLLQYALMELFDLRQDGRMTWEDYEEIGGVLGALGRRAEEEYDRLDEPGQAAARQLFLRLVTIGESVEDTRRRVLRSELLALETQGLPNKGMNTVIDSFGLARLLTFDRDPLTREPTVEVAHEALLREWSRLRGWLDESRNDVRMQRLLAQGAADWQKAGGDDSYLLRGSRLEQFAGWAALSTVALTGDEQSYLDAALAARRSRQAEEEARHHRELETAQQLAETERVRAEEQAANAGRLQRRAAFLAGALVVAAVLAIAAIFFARQSNENARTADANAALASTRESEALQESDRRATAQALAEEEGHRADQEREAALVAQAEAQAESDIRATAEVVADAQRLAAEEQARLAFSRELASAALKSLTEDQERAVLLALQALDEARTQEAEDALHRAVQELRLLRTLDAPGKSPFVDLSPDGRRLVSSGSAGAAVWDVTTGEILYEFDVGHWINRAAFSPDGTVLILPHENTSEENPEGYLEPSAVTIVDASTGRELLTFLAHDAWVQDVSFSHDGTLLASASGDGTIKVWDLAATLETGEGQERLSLTADTIPWTVNFSPDGARLATAHDDGTVWIWDSHGGQELLRLNADSFDLAFSPDGTRLVTGSWTGMLDVWDADSGQRLSRNLAHNLSVYAVMFSPDGSQIASTSEDSTIKVWAFADDAVRPLMTLAGHKVRASNLDFSPDGARLVSGSTELGGQDLTVRIWDISPGGSPEPVAYPHAAIVNSITFTPDGARLATASADGNARIWGAADGQLLYTLIGHDWIWRVSFSPDGSLLATAGRDATVILWDVASGQKLSTLANHIVLDESEYFRGVLGIAFSPNGERLATAGGDGHVRVWDVATLRVGDQNIGDELLSIEGRAVGQYGQFATDVSYSPDGRWIAASINNYADTTKNYGAGTITIWDASTGQLIWTLGDDDGKTVTSLTFSPDGQRLAGGVIQAQVTVWRLPDGRMGVPEELLTIQTGKPWVAKMDFSPDGTQLTVPHRDGMGIWDAIDGTYQGTFPHPSGVMEAVFSPDGKRLATAGTDGVGRLFFLDMEELTTLARSRLTRWWTESECQLYLHLEACPAEP